MDHEWLILFYNSPFDDVFRRIGYSFGYIASVCKLWIIVCSSRNNRMLYRITNLSKIRTIGYLSRRCLSINQRLYRQDINLEHLFADEQLHNSENSSFLLIWEVKWFSNVNLSINQRLFRQDTNLEHAFANEPLNNSENYLF